MTGKIREKTVWLMKLLSLCLALALVLEMAPVHAETFDQKVAANGTNFQPLSDDEKTDFLLFGSTATAGDGMSHRWKMLNKHQVASVQDKDSAAQAFGITGSDNLWKDNISFSATSDGQTFDAPDSNIKGIDLSALAEAIGINWELWTKIQFTTIGKDGSQFRSDSDMLQNKFGEQYTEAHVRYYFDSFSPGDKSTWTKTESLLKVDNGKFSLRVGQKEPTDKNKDNWRDNLKTLQIDAVTTATQNYEVVFSAYDKGKQEDYVLSDIVDAGQYKAEFAYYDDANKPVTAEVEGASLADVLAQRSISPSADDIIYAVDEKGSKTQLKSGLNSYLLAYKGKEQKEGAGSVDLTSKSEFCLFGPGTKESEVKVKDIYSVEVVKKPAPAPAPTPVAAPKATKILKLTKKNRSITVKWKKISGINGYQVSMATKKNGKYKTIKTVTKAGTVKYTKKKLKKGKKYYFKVRTYKTVSGVKYYSPWSAAKYKKL